MSVWMQVGKQVAQKYAFYAIYNNLMLSDYLRNREKIDKNN